VPAIDTPLLVVGGGPAALVLAQVASGAGLASLVAGHEVSGGDEPTTLDDESVAVLRPHGVLGVLTPYAARRDPFAIAPAVFEEVLKHHCVVDMVITVYDGMSLVDAVPDGDGVDGALTDGRSRWPVHADAVVDTSSLPTELNGAIHAGAAAARDVLARLRTS
jgi:hypothetical protein